jgi:hypothetical protein
MNSNIHGMEKEQADEYISAAESKLQPPASVVEVVPPVFHFPNYGSAHHDSIVPRTSFGQYNTFDQQPHFGSDGEMFQNDTFSHEDDLERGDYIPDYSFSQRTNPDQDNYAQDDSFHDYNGPEQDDYFMSQPGPSSQ